MYFFGPASSFTHGGTELGKTYGGGSLSLLRQTQKNISNDYDPGYFVYGGEGKFSFYSWSGITIGTSLELYGFGEIVITTPNAIVTLYKCKILLDANDMNMGKNEQQAINVKLIFTHNDAGNLINIT